MFLSRFALAFACLLFIAGCSGIGDGARPESIVILQAPVNQVVTREQVLNPTDDPPEAFACIRTQLRAFVVFSDGNVGDFTSRARWKSNNKDVLTVSNGDEKVEDRKGLFFGFGSVAPRAAGTARVSAEYLGLRASVPVSVSPSGDLVITPANFRMAPNTLQALRVTSLLDGKVREVTGAMAFSLEGDDDGTVANKNDPSDTDRYAILDSTTPNLLSAFDADTDFNRVIGDVDDLTDDVDDEKDSSDLDDRGDAAPLLRIEAKATVPDCKAPVFATVQVSKVPANGLVLQYQDGFAGQIAEGTSQRLQLTAHFGDFNGDGDTDDEDEFQDLSNQVQSSFAYDRDGDGDCDIVDLDPPVEDPDPEYPAAVLSLGSFLTRTQNRVVGVVDDPDDKTDEPNFVCARYGFRTDPDKTDEANGPLPSDPGVLSNSLPMAVIDGPLKTLSAEAFDPCSEEDAAKGFCEPLDPPLADPLQPVVKAGHLISFSARGSFFTDAQKRLRQTITEHVVWSSSDTDLAVIGPLSLGSVSLASGQLFALPDVEGTVTVTARFVRGVVDSDPPDADDRRDEVVEIPVTIVPDDED